MSPTGPKITAGESVDITTQTVPSSGGTVVVDATGSAIDGMVIEVPNGAYEEGRSFNVATRVITEHGFGSEISILTPLIEISNGGGYSEEPMTIRVPVSIPKGHFALAFQYDEATQSLEALPLIFEDSTEVRFITRHFSHSSIAASTAAQPVTSKLRSTIQGDGRSRSTIFISSIDAAMLDETFDTHFEMGEDNFRFVNWGSYIAPTGHCGGQSIAMMWYYSMKKKNGSPGLNGVFDNDGIERTPEIWYDDVHAFRFCSILQTKMHWTNMEIYGDLEKSWERDLATYRSIAFAIRETGNPQCLYVSNGSDKNSIAHAIIAYKTSNGHITVCDPNFPVQEKDREIVFLRGLGDFEPYYSGFNAGSVGTGYFNIYHAANSALIDYDLLSEQYSKVLDGTIGADEYPSVRVKVRNANDEYVDLHDGMKIPAQQTIDVTADGFGPYYTLWDFATRKQILMNDRDFVLTKGKHRIGVYYSDLVNGNPESGFIGFKWFNVEVVEEAPTSDPEYGSIRLNLRVNGVSKTLFSANFEYNLYRTIRASGANGSELYLAAGDQNWGVGTFVLPPSSSNAWKEGDKLYTAVRPGTLTITSWSKTKAEGTFTFPAEDSGGNDVVVEGDFHYPP